MTKAAGENMSAGDKPKIEIKLKITRDGDGWDWEFSGPPDVVIHSEGILRFSGFNEPVDVAIVITDSPGVQFPSNADLCVAFDKDQCPITSEMKDKDVFKHLTVKGGGSILCFVNHNRKGLFYYALFVEADGKTISHDPIIINKNN